MPFAKSPEPDPLPPDGEPDPVREANDVFVRHLAFLLETAEQMHDAYEERHAAHERRIGDLERAVAVLESLLLGRGGS
jgi:hypothetical protein